MELSAVVNLVTKLNPPLPRFNNLNEWLAWQEKLHFTSIELGLARCRQVAEAMQLFPPAYFVVSIAGTNGKGSSAVMLEQILRAAGYRVGLYTSPHLVRYNERIRINGIEVSDRDLCSAFASIDEARADISLTYFEFATLAAMQLFQQNNIDIAVMEVGLGGRLDAVNMLDADISLISTIDIDHEQWLGHDRGTIAREKAGIFRSRRPAVCADPNPPSTLLETADVVGANLLRSGHEFSHERAGDSWSWRSGMIQYERLPLPGNQGWQVQNASGVLMVLTAISEYFPVDQQVVFSSLRNFNMPGRFQLIPGKNATIILDVAHNRQSAAMLAANIKTLSTSGRTRMVLGMLKDKNHAAFIKELSAFVDDWYLATLDDARGASSQDLAGVIHSAAIDGVVYEFSHLKNALIAAQNDTTKGDCIIITGSFVTVSHAIKHLGIKT